MNKNVQYFVLNEVKELLGSNEFEKLEDFFITNPNAPESIRVNSLRYDVEEYVSIAKDQGVHFKRVQGNFPDAYYVTMDESVRPWWNRERLWGKFYSQGNSSLIPPIYLFDTDDYSNMENLKVLDMCASPGSKTTQIGSLMKNKGLLVANDIKSHRLYSLHRNLQAFGVANTVVTQLDGRWVAGRWPNFFDKILVDAPCSGTGSNRKNFFKDRNKEAIFRYQKIQKELLSSAIKGLKTSPASSIIYSTCSLLPLENELVIQPLLDEGLIKLEKMDYRLLSGWKVREGLQKWKNEDLSSEFQKAIRIHPHENDSDAFFIAKIKKIGNEI